MERTQRFHMTPARREAFWAYGLISPWIIGFLIFTLAERKNGNNGKNEGN